MLLVVLHPVSADDDCRLGRESISSHRSPATSLRRKAGQEQKLHDVAKVGVDALSARRAR